MEACSSWELHAPHIFEEVFMMKKTFKVLAIALVLVLAVAMSVSAYSLNKVTLNKTMYYVSGAANSFTSSQAVYYGYTWPDSNCSCQVYLFGKTANGNTGISSRIVKTGEKSPSTGPFTASRYGVTSWYAYAQPYGSSSGLGGHCEATAQSY